MNEVQLYACLASSLRLEVLKSLATGEQCVSDLMEATGAEQTNLSHHLAQLRSCGLVRTRQDGKRIQYSLAHPGLAALLQLGFEHARHATALDPIACAGGCC